MRTRTRIGLLTLAFAGIAGGAFAAYRHAYRRGHVSPLLLGRDAVIFIVTDNVRADHTGLCGYDRPTTPTLSALSSVEGARFTCRAYAPGSWTLPSHASFFTGQSVIQHGAHEYDGTVENPEGTGILAKLLQPEETTLAETMRERGYQTALIAGNPIVSKRMGLGQGYQYVHTARKFGQLDAEKLDSTLQYVLRRELDPTGGPLFLTVNLADAHRPWLAIPRDHPFLHPRGRLQFDNEAEDGKWRSFLEGRMSAPEKRKFIDHITDVYDYGVERADTGVRRVLAAVRESGWCRERCRIVITSDHGEFIGEHGLIDHGFYTYEENANVFVLAVGGDIPVLPEPLSASAAYWLVRDGALPETLPPVEQWAWPHVRRAIHSQGHAFGSASVARWTGFAKEMWMDGTYLRFDLRADPHELAALTEDPDADFAALLQTLDANRMMTGMSESSVTEALKAAGYME